MTHPVTIESVMEAIKETAPKEVISVTWEFPGFVSIMFENSDQISFGESLDYEEGYSWQIDNEGGEFGTDSFGNYATAREVAEELWNQFRLNTNGVK